MKEPDLKKIRKAMEKELDPKRYEHTLGVALYRGFPCNVLRRRLKQRADCRHAPRLREMLKQ